MLQKFILNRKLGINILNFSFLARVNLGQLFIPQRKLYKHQNYAICIEIKELLVKVKYENSAKLYR